MYDDDDQGLISRDNLQRCADDLYESVHGEELDEMIKMADHNRKGGVDLKHFILLMKELGLIPPKDVKFWEFDKPNDFISKFDEIKAGDDLFIVYITAGVGEDFSESWCPDSNAAMVNVKDHVLDKTSLVVMKGNIMEKSQWVGVGLHPFKTHPVIQAAGTPTLLLVGNRGQVLLRADTRENFNNRDLLSSICEGEWKSSDYDENEIKIN